MLAKVALAALLLLVFSGCAESPSSNEPPELPGPTTSESAPTSSSNEGPEPMPPAAAPLQAVFSQCSEWTTATGGPAGEVPENWAATLPAAIQLIQFDECQRVSWGAFERGPIRLIFELSEDFTAPGTCEEGDWERAHILRTLWIDDPEVGAWLASTYGLPVRIGLIDIEKTEAPAGTVESWSWAEPSGVPSEIHFQYPPISGDTQLSYRHRLFWFNGPAANYLDFAESFLNDDNASPGAAGVLQAPTFYTSSTGMNAYAGGVDRALDSEISVSVTMFDNSDCVT